MVEKSRDHTAEAPCKVCGLWLCLSKLNCKPRGDIQPAGLSIRSPRPSFFMFVVRKKNVEDTLIFIVADWHECNLKQQWFAANCQSAPSWFVWASRSLFFDYVCAFSIHDCLLFRPLGQYGGVHMYDSKRHTWWSILSSSASPASGPLLIGTAGGLQHLLRVRDFSPFNVCYESVLLESLSLRKNTWDLPDLRFLEFSLVFKARIEKLKLTGSNTAKEHKSGFTAIPDRIELPHQLRHFIKRNKTQEVCLLFFLLQCGASSVWKCYVI